MSPELRSFVKLTPREERILQCIIKGYNSKEIITLTRYSASSVKSDRRILLKKFNATSSIHLIAIAVLDYKYYQILSPSPISALNQITLSKQDLQIVFYILQGYYNQEIADKVGVTNKSIEYRRSKFINSLSINGNADFVRKCIENGLFVITPIKYRFRKMDYFGQSLKTFKISNPSLPIQINIDYLNQTGFLYTDYLARFNYTFLRELDSDNSFITAITVAHCLSDIPSELIAKKLISVDFDSLGLIRSVADATYNKMEYDLISSEIDAKRFHLNIQKAQFPNIYSVGHLLLLTSLINDMSEEKILLRLKMDKKTLDDQKQILRSIWNCHTELGVLMTFLHLNFFSTNDLSL